MKAAEKKEARRLRKDEGMSVRTIAKTVGVSKGTVSIWVRDIELTDMQKQQLALLNPTINGQMAGAKKRKELARQDRLAWQEEGKHMAEAGDVAFIAGCMLYWAEGDKSRHTCGMSNSDPDMIMWFVRWLQRFLAVHNADITMCLNVYLNTGLTLSDVEDYWLRVTGLRRDNLRKSMVNHFPTSSSGKKVGKLPYGTCRIRVNNVAIVQRIYGAIKAYAGTSDVNKWLD